MWISHYSRRCILHDLSGIGLIEKYTRVRPPLWIPATDLLIMRFFVFHISILCLTVTRVVSKNEHFLIASTICYASVTSFSLSSSMLGKKDTLPYHFFRINWWKGELNKAKHEGVRPASLPLFLSILLSSSLMIAEYTLWMCNYFWY